MPATHDIKTIEDVFGVWESLAEMARDLDVDYQRLAKWSQRGRIPYEYFDLVTAKAKRRRVRLSSELLSRLNAPRGTVSEQASG
jgi:predicted site-specific integrase-resolvase